MRSLINMMDKEKWVNLTELKKQLAHELSVAYRVGAAQEYIRGLLDTMEMINAVPTISTVRRVWAAKGKWLPFAGDAETCECSVCGGVCITRSNYCPECGARMED